MHKMKEMWMSPNGDDRHDGSKQTPLRSLPAMAARVRRIVAEEKPDEIVVHVAPGSYEGESCAFTGEVNGSVRVVVRGPGAGSTEVARFTGAATVPALEAVPDDVAVRLAPEVRRRIRMIDLSRFGTIGDFASRGFGRPLSPSHPELFIDDQPATISRWPKEGFHTIAGFPEEGGKDDEHGTIIGDGSHGFLYGDRRFESWGTLDDVMLHGYWSWDWANTYEAIESVDRERKLIKLAPPGSSWGFRTGNRYQFINVLDEISSPGEYAVDTKRRRIYLYPPDRYERISVSVSSGPAVRLEQARNVRFEGIVFEGFRGTAVEVQGGDGVVFEGCEFRNIGNHALRIDGGTNHTVRRCTIRDTGDGGIWANGGDRKSLTPSNHLFEENHIYRFGMWSRCYVPAIHASGVGMRISKNLMHDAPHTAIIYLGNDFLIEYNEIHHVTQESGDAGAIYTGRDFTARGNVMRYNYIHDTGGEGMGSMGIYWDDCVSGQTAYGNLFVRVSRGMMMGGGRELVVENNIFVDALPAIQIDSRGVSPALVWQRMVNETMRKRLEEVNYTAPPYSERYPELLELTRYMEAGKGVPAEHNVIARNICSGGVWIDAGVSGIRRRVGTDYGAANRMARIEKNLIDYDPGFTDRANDDYTFADSRLADAIGFEPIPFDEIGPSWVKR